MKKFGRVLIFALMFALVAALFAACDSAKYYSVTLVFDEARGTASVSAPSSAKGYKEGETVEVVATPNEGYYIGSVKAGNDELSLSDGKYAFTVQKATAVTVDFTAYVQLTVECEAAKGTLTLSAPENEAGYRVGERVEVTVDVKPDYLLDKVLAGDDELTAEDGVYSFVVSGDCTVSATFSEDGPETGGLPRSGIQQAFRGMWKSPAGTTLKIGQKRITYKGDRIASATIGGSGNETAYIFEYEGDRYSMTWGHTKYGLSFVIQLLNMTEDTREYFIHDPAPEVEMEEHFIGTWYGNDADVNDDVLVITADGLTYNGSAPDAIVDAGYQKDSDDGENSSPINSHQYFFIQNGTLHLLSWYPDGGIPIVDGKAFSSVKPVPTVPSSLYGTWKGHVSGQEVTLEISAAGITIDGDAYEPSMSYDSLFALVYGGKDYSVAYYTGSEVVLQFMHAVYEEGSSLPTGYENLFFLKEGRAAVTVDPDLAGTWTAGTHTVVIEGNGVSLDGDPFVVAERRDGEEGAEEYLLYAGGKLYTLSYDGGDTFTLAENATAGENYARQS